MNGDRLSVVATRDGADVCRVQVTGEIDFGSAGLLRASLQEAVDAGTARIVVDLAGVTFCDSSGLGVLVGTRSQLAARQGALELTGAEGQVARLLQITGLERLFAPGARMREARAS
jgi:anti-sigma B factor antagonist